MCSIRAIGGMSEEAKYIQIHCAGRMLFEADFQYLNRLWPALFALSSFIMTERELEIRLMGDAPKMRAGVVLSGVFDAGH